MQQPFGSEETTYAMADNAALYDRHGPAIFAYVRLYIHSREDAEDLTLEVFIGALEQKHLARLQEGEQLAWLRRVAHNKLIDRYRRATRHPIGRLDDLLERGLADDAANPEQVMLRRETYTQLHQAVQTLSPLQQQLLRLRYGDGLRFTEIAVLLNKREDALRKLLSRTLVTLRTLYSQPVQEGESTC
jgi:RNA polymerase sigma-70 factor, ECF subfamily